MLIKDGTTGRRFRSTRAEVDRAIVEFNNYLLQNGTAYLTDLYDILGLERSDVCDHLRIDNRDTARILDVTWDWESNDQDIDEPMMVFMTDDWEYVRD